MFNMEPSEQSPLLESVDLTRRTARSSTVTPTIPTSYQDFTAKVPSSSTPYTVGPIIPTPCLQQTPTSADSSDLVDGIIPAANGWSHYSYTEDSQSENDPDGLEVKTETYLSRFWILFSFSILGWFQCLQWNTWGPLSESMNAAFPGWGAETVAMMANWGTITFVLFVTPMCWLMNTRGLRVGVLCCALLVATGTLVRVIPLFTNSALFFTVMCHICAILVGTAGTLVMAAPPMIAAVWFPPKERTTATAVAQVLNQLGSAGSYMEPIFVHSPSNGTTPAEIRSDIKKLMYIYAGVGLAILGAILLYFPSMPPSPPSITSSKERLNFKASIRKMFRNRDLLLVTLSYGLCVGIPGCWISVLNYSLYDLGMYQSDATWVGLTAVVTSGLVGLASGRLTDLVYGKVKVSIIIVSILNLGCLYWFFLLTWGSITVTKWQIYVSVVGSFSFSFATAPLYFELAVESAYPCSEVIIGGLLTATNNLTGVVFLLLFFIPNIGYQWMTYVLIGSTAAALVPLMFIQEDYLRSTIDRHVLLQSSYQAI